MPINTPSWPLKIGDGDGNDGNVNVTPDHEMATHDAKVQAAVDAAKASSDSKLDTLNTTLGTLATQTKLEAVRVLLASLDGKDFATNAKLESVRLLLSSLDGKDYATQTTLAAAKTTLDQIYVAVDGLEASLTSLDGKDYATQATLALVKGVLDSILSSQATAANQQTMVTAFGSITTADTLLYFQKIIADAQKPQSRKTSYDSGFVSRGAPSVWGWREIQAWALPAGKLYVPLFFSMTASAAGYIVRLVERAPLGILTAPGTFSDGIAGVDNNDPWTDVQLEVTTGFGGGTNTVDVNITYVNQDGVSKTALTTFPRNKAVGTRVRMVLASGDSGVVDITGVTLVNGQTSGEVKFYGFKFIAQMGTSAAGDSRGTPVDKLTLRGGRDLVFEMTAAATTAAKVQGAVTGYFQQEG